MYLAKRVRSWFGFARQYRTGLSISGAVCLLSLGLYASLYWGAHPSPLFRLLADIELRTLDLRFRVRGPEKPNQAIVIVAIDQKSQDLLGRWPFPRSYFAELVDFLREAQARVVAFDINFPQPDENSALQALYQVIEEYKAVEPRTGREAQFERQIKEVEEQADNDQKFANALSRYDNAILGYFLLFRKDETQTQDRERVQEFLNYLSFQAYPQVAHPEYGRLFQCPYCQAAGVSPDLPKLALYAKNFGFFNVVPDSDGTVRRAPVVVRFQDHYYPSLDIAAALAFARYPLEQVAVIFNSNGLEGIDFGTLTIPTDPDGYVQVDFHGPTGTFPTYSLADVLKHKVPPDYFRNRLVLVGSTATGIADMIATPYQKMAFPGVEVHANLVDDILDGHFIRRGVRENLIDIGLIVLFSLALGGLFSAISPARATVVLLITLGLFFFLAFHLFAARRMWISMFLPASTLAANYAGVVSYRFFFEEREKRKVRGMFQHYVAPSVIDHLLRQPELLKLGGEETELTAMFCDIRGFTRLSEELPPKALVSLLNEYLSEMTEVIFRHCGTLDKYMGDAMLAFWGAPYPQPDHAVRACHAALEMVRTLSDLQSRWDQLGRPQIEIGVGINTGAMLVGNLGSRRRFNFTVMGDNVNLASRLEGLNKLFGTRVIIGQATYDAARQKAVARELDLIRVAGKQKPVKIYELLGGLEDLEGLRSFVGRFEEGLQAYRDGRWEAAIRVFARLVGDFPRDRPSRLFLKRCQGFFKRPPEGVWDGVYVMRAK